MDERYTVETPENIAFTYEVAGIGSRILAAIIDTLLILLLQLLPIIAGVALGALVGEDFAAPASSLLVAAWAIVSFIFLWGYYLLFELVWAGQSPGKRLFGLRVIRDGGRPVTFVTVAIRNLVRFIDFLPGFYGIGVLTMFVDPRARRLGDLAAGTLVVREMQPVTLESLTAAPTPALTPLPLAPRPLDAPPEPLVPHLDRLSDHEYDLVQEFLRRRDQLAFQRRTQLATQLAAGLRARLDLPPGGDPELFLEHLVREYQVLRSEI